MIRLSQDLYTFLQGMHQYILALEKRVQLMEKKMKTLSDELNEHKSRPPVHVGTIEYKFDQLKVETLEGTLNIGLNPADLDGIGELQVDKPKAGFSPKQMMKRTMNLEDAVHHYLEKDLEPLVTQYGQQLEIEVNDAHLDFIRNDIKEQLPQRIQYYYNQIPSSERSPAANEKITEQIQKQLIRDIENAVMVFLKNLPDTRKDENS